MNMSRGRSAVALLAVWCLIAAVIASGLIVWAERVGDATVLVALRDARPWLLLWRFSLLTALLVYWRPIVAWTSKRFRLSRASETELQRWRWRAATWLVVMDLVLVEDLVGLLRYVA
jgi:hypothetical protein